MGQDVEECYMYLIDRRRHSFDASSRRHLLVMAQPVPTYLTAAEQSSSPPAE